MRSKIQYLRRLTAPFLIQFFVFLLRFKPIPAKIRCNIWVFMQKYILYLGVWSNTKIINKMNMLVSSAPRVEQEILLFDVWEPSFTNYLLSREKCDGIFVDVGANIGYFSLIASKLFKEVHAIEASPSIADRLDKNIKLNNINNIKIHNIAISDRKGFVDFYLDKNQSGGSSVNPSIRNQLECKVESNTLESILSQIGIDKVMFIKLDIEGMEPQALKSLRNIIGKIHSEVEIFVEFMPDRHGTWPEIEAFLKFGFHIFLVQGPYQRMEYLLQGANKTLDRVTGPPNFPCDLLMKRQNNT